MDDTLKIAKRYMPGILRRYRNASGFSQQQLVDKVGISRGFYSLLERGKRAPNLDMIVRISLALGVDTGEMVNAMVAEWKKNDPEGYAFWLQWASRHNTGSAPSALK